MADTILDIMPFGVDLEKGETYMDNEVINIINIDCLTGEEIEAFNNAWLLVCKTLDRLYPD